MRDTTSRESSRSRQDAESGPLLLDRLTEHKQNFHQNRLRCLQYPDRALDTLEPCMELNITIDSARSLMALTEKDAFRSPSQPYVMAFLDDNEVFQTTKKNSGSPQWQEREKIGCIAPTSMVRLQVNDAAEVSSVTGKDIVVGFVEFCIGDLPWEKNFRGWLELRHADMLEKTSAIRYPKHKKSRDEDANDEKHNLRDTAWKKQATGRGGFCSAGACSAKPLGADTRQNGGELLVEFRLRRLEPWTSTTLAHALDPPVPKHFDARKVMDDSMLPALNTQSVGDEVFDIRMALYDGAFACSANFIGYILRWRSFVLSTSICSGLIATWIYPWLTFMVIPFMLAVLLILLWSEQFRKETCVGGLNAGLCQEGFEQVARWRNTDAMGRFVRRIVEQDLQGKVKDEQEFRACAALCFSDGVPKMSYDQLRSALKDVDWTDVPTGELEPGTLVAVNGERRAKVVSVKGKQVSVQYDNGMEGTVSTEDVMPRIQIPTIPLWAVPTSITNQIRVLEYQVHKLKGFMGPVKKAKNVLTWKTPAVSGSIVAALLAFALLETLIMSTIVDKGHWVETVSNVIKHVLYQASIVARLGLGFWILFCQAPWFQWIRSFLKISMRMLTMRRQGPKAWSFFRAEAGESKVEPTATKT